MLRGIPEIITPDLMKIIMEMGHGDEICLGDANFPANSMGKRVVRADGHKITQLLPALLELFPLDIFVKQPVVLMQTLSESEAKPTVWESYNKILQEKDFAKAFSDFEYMERYAFYDRAKECYAVVATTEYEAYANIILKKGVIFK